MPHPERYSSESTGYIYKVARRLCYSVDITFLERGRDSSASCRRWRAVAFICKYIENKASGCIDSKGGYPENMLFIANWVVLGVSPLRVVRLSLSKDYKHGHGARWVDTTVISMALPYFTVHSAHDHPLLT